MCVGFWSLTHPDYALILCTNRDEYLARPTADAHFHSFENLDSTEERHPGAGSVLSGRDLLAGGTWFGLSRAGRLALLTNVTEPPATYASSRGHLLTSVLLAPTAGRDLERETEVLLRENEHTSYAGFNLLLLAPAVNPPDGKLAFDANFVTNSGGGGTLHSRALSGPERNCSGMSNGIDGHGADAWPKVVHGTAVLNSLLPAISPETTEEELAERLFALLTGGSAHPPRDRAELKNAVRVDPLYVQSTPGQASQVYGTRLSTIVLIRRDGHVLFIERDIWQLDHAGVVHHAAPSSQRTFRFKLELDMELHSSS